MKRVYEKPTAYIERFELAQSIAAGCGGASKYENTTATSTDITSCTFLVGGSAFFTWDQTNCIAGELPDLCYNAPSEGDAIFKS